MAEQEIKFETPTVTYDIPIPASVRQYAKMPITGMRVGGSFFIPEYKPKNFWARASEFHRMGWKFTTRKCTENGILGMRVWRIA